MISVDEAHKAVVDFALDLGVESIPVNQLERRVLADEVVATREQPPFDRVAMDGIAINVRECKQSQRKIETIQRAGVPQESLKNISGAIEVMTGSVLPQGCDTVVPYERCKIENGIAYINSDHILESGKNIHFTGSDYPEGKVLLSSGTKLISPTISIIASQGVTKVNVFKMPKVAIVGTGDELIDLGEKCKPWQIWRSNPYGIKAQLHNLGLGDDHIDFFHINDDAAELFIRLKKIIEDYDMVIMSGGVSAGKYDFVHTTLADLGVTQHFHKVAQKPGRPLLLGTVAGEKVIFGLPGNPVSALVCTRRFVITGLQASLKQSTKPLRAVLNKDITFKKGLELFAPVQIASNHQGQLTATPLSSNGSGDFFSLANSHGICQLPAAGEQFCAGEVYPVYPWQDSLCP